MSRPAAHPARAFTLIELISVIVILGVISGATAPLLVSASDTYTRAASNREAIERAAFALERVVKSLRDAPDSPSGSGVAGITAASATSLTFSDGRKIELIGTTLWLTLPAGVASPLCQNVAGFTLGYLTSDGRTDALSAPTTAQRINIRITAGGVELRASAFLRCTMGAP